MRAILVPTDFSATSHNAAMYALELAKQLGVTKLVLYHSYQAPLSIDPTVPAMQLLDMDLLKEGSREGLQQFKLQLQAFCPKEIILDTFNEFGLLTDGLDNVCMQTDADLIVMGITGGNAVEETLFGSNTISVAKHSTVPVIIVPSKAAFTRIGKVLFACDLKKVAESTPVQPIKNILDTTGAKLFVLNVDRHKTYDEETSLESQVLDTLLEGYHPEYHFISSKDFTEAINNFALEKQIDLIIVVPRKHGFFEDLFTRSHTKMLAFHSHVPLMVVHE
ncbi:MAG: universal stress protein [Sediminibacterium sp.]